MLTSYRVSLIKGMMPSWVCAITGGCLCLFLEKSIVDPRKRYMQLVSKNITCNQVHARAGVWSFCAHV